MNTLRKLAPHAAILIGNMYYVFWGIDRVNKSMNFIDNEYTKFLLVLLIALCAVVHWPLLKAALRRSRRGASPAALATQLGLMGLNALLGLVLAILLLIDLFAPDMMLFLKEFVKFLILLDCVLAQFHAALLMALRRISVFRAERLWDFFAKRFFCTERLWDFLCERRVWDFFAKRFFCAERLWDFLAKRFFREERLWNFLCEKQLWDFRALRFLWEEQLWDFRALCFFCEKQLRDFLCEKQLCFNAPRTVKRPSTRDPVRSGVDFSILFGRNRAVQPPKPVCVSRLEMESAMVRPVSSFSYFVN